MKITKIKFYDGARDKVCRLGIADLFLELQQVILDTPITLLEEKDANGAAAVRVAIDCSFERMGGWEKKGSGGVDWIKKIRYNQSILSRLGVEVQVSARSDLLIRDIVHLRNSLQGSEIDIGVIVVPDNRMQHFLPDRTPCFKDAIRYVEEEFKEAMTFPIIIIAIEHDGPGAPLAKKRKKDVTVEVDTIREEMPPDLKKKLFPDDEPADPAKVRQSASTASKKGSRENP